MLFFPCLGIFQAYKWSLPNAQARPISLFPNVQDQMWPVQLLPSVPLPAVKQQKEAGELWFLRLRGFENGDDLVALGRARRN